MKKLGLLLGLLLSLTMLKADEGMWLMMLLNKNISQMQEMGLQLTAEDIYNYPVHPYTKSLLSAIPLPDPISEATRTRIPYEHEEVGDDAKSHEVCPGHFVFGTDAQVKEWYTH